MITILSGSDEYFIEQKLKEKEKDAEIFRFDGRNRYFSAQEVVDACQSSSLFHEKTAVFVKDPPFFVQKDETDEYQAIYDYCAHPVYECELVFYTYQNNFRSNLKAYKTIASNAEVVRMDSYQDKQFIPFALSLIRKSGLDITSEASGTLAQISKPDTALLMRNIRILSLYPEKITSDAVRGLCTENDTNRSFDLLNALIRKETGKAFSALRHQMKNNDATSVVVFLAAQLRFMYHVDHLSRQGYKKNEIVDLLKANDYRVRSSLEALEHTDRDEILRMLKQLRELDLRFKSDNSISDKERLELFVLHTTERS